MVYFPRAGVTRIKSMTEAFPSKKIGATSLMYACQQGKDTNVINIVNAKPGAVLERERTLKTALHYCAESGDGGVSSATVLLEAAPELVIAQDQDGYSALHLAVIAGNLALTKLLLSHGAPINMPDNEGHTPTHWATVCGEVDCLELLLGKGGDSNVGDMHGGCPLHYAAQMCGPFSDMPADRRLGMAALRILLENSADPNLPDNHGRQPILWAASAGSSEAILVLVGAGANVAAADKDGLTASRGHTDCVETLINLCTAEPDVIDNNGCSALFYSVTLGHADATQTLLNHGANTNRQDRKGRSAAHCGAAKGQLETLKVVAACGGNLWQKTVRGDYPLHDAVASGRHPLVMWLLSLRPDSVNAPNNDGRCPLHIAAINNNVEMSKTLLDAGSLVNPVMRTAKGSLATPLDAALHKGHRGCAKYLQLHGGVPSSRLNSESAALRGLSSNRGEKSAKDHIKDKLLGVEEPNIEFKVDPKPHNQSELLPIDDSQSGVPERDKPHASPRPHILQVYVEDDLMIRRLRHHEGSDSSIEERVRRRRRKRKTKIMSERDRSAPANVQHLSSRRLSSSDEISDFKQFSRSAEPDRDVMVEKLVQTEFSLKPDLQSPVESMIIEGVNERIWFDENLQNSLENPSITKGSNVIALDTSSGDSDKKSGVQIVEAQIHKEQRSIESEELKVSGHEHEKSSSLDDSSKAIQPQSDMVTVEEQQSGSMIRCEDSKSETKIHPTSEDHQDQASPEKDIGNTLAKTQLQNDNHSSSNEVTTSEVNQDEIKHSHSKLGMVSGDTSPETSGRQHDTKTHLGDEGELQPTTVSLEHQGSGQNGITCQRSAQLDQQWSAHNEMENGRSSPIEKQKSAQNENFGSMNGKGVDNMKIEGAVPNDEIVADVLIQSVHEDSQNSHRPSSHDAHDGQHNKVQSTETQIADSAKISENEVRNSFEECKKDIHEEEKYKSSGGEIVNMPKDIEVNGAKKSYDLSEMQESSAVITERMLSPDDRNEFVEHSSQVNVNDVIDLIGKQDEQVICLKDSFDVEGSLDELALNITKDSDDAPPELGLPDPIIDEDWDSKFEADKLAADGTLPIGDRGLIKVLGDPTGGSSFTVDKRRKLRRKREGSKKWMNSRSTESFEVLKLPDEKTDDEAVSDVEGSGGTGHEPNGKKEKSNKLPPQERTRVSRACRRGRGTELEAALSSVSVTQAVQYSVRKYHLERRIFHQLLELKRLQIRAGRASEAVLVKRLVDEYKRSGLMLGLQQYDGVYTFRSFEKFLYEQLRLLQTSERRIIPRLRSTDDLERLTAALRKTRVGQEILASVPNNPALCTYQTHRCHHATHAYTGIPCAAYITRPNHHTMPKPIPYTGFLPKLVNDENQGEVAKTLRHVDPSRPLTLELSHGPDKQVITLPTEKLDKSKKYFVTFTIKSGNQKKNELKHSHATSI